MPFGYKEDSIQEFSGSIQSYTNAPHNIPLILSNAIHDTEGVLKAESKNLGEEWYRLKNSEENPDIWQPTGVAGNLVFNFDNTRVRTDVETTGKVYGGVSYIIAKILI
ncbi:MAG: hypothetical protein LBH40_03525 [Alphaproteobacteria bacterium]|jgi:hypothetical protein|nr:hypothetical protein [Alphaproteobacteria bacterium]